MHAALRELKDRVEQRRVREGRPLHRQGRRRQDHDGRGHRAALRRCRAAHARAVAPIRRTRWRTRSTCRSAPRRRAVADGSAGQQLDAQERMEESWGEIQAYLVEVFDWAGVEAIEAEELAVIPGLDEVFALSDIKDARRRRASGTSWSSTARRRPRRSGCCRCPTSSSWYMDRLFPVSRRLNRVVGPSCRGSRTCRSPATRCSARPGASTTASTGCASC